MDGWMEGWMDGWMDGRNGLSSLCATPIGYPDNGTLTSVLYTTWHPQYI